MTLVRYTVQAFVCINLSDGLKVCGTHVYGTSMYSVVSAFSLSVMIPAQIVLLAKLSAAKNKGAEVGSRDRVLLASAQGLHGDCRRWDGALHFWVCSAEPGTLVISRAQIRAAFHLSLSSRSHISTRSSDTTTCCRSDCLAIFMTGAPPRAATPFSDVLRSGRQASRVRPA